MNTIFLYYLVVIFGSINLLRMAFFLIGSDIYNLKAAIQKKKKRAWYPSFSVVIPAHNEESHILMAVESVFNNKYPENKIQVIVVDDGSTDNTSHLVKNFIKLNPNKVLKLIKVRCGGKAKALNVAMKKHVKGSLVMCLDADSTLDPMAISNTVEHFRDKKVQALATNVKIKKRKGLLNFIQQYEYLICYQMKRAESLFNFEYIVGGIGSTFRKSVLEKIGYYDTNTVTEDIDLTMKILRLGNKNYKTVYGSDVITYTEAVLTIKGLLVQRFRWKWGRSQTFLKNKEMFFSRNKKYTKGLTWFYLPFALYGDIAYFFEPILLFYILVNSIIYSDPFAIICASAVITFYVVFNILSENTIDTKGKFIYILFSPLMYILFYVLSFVEYVALVKTVLNTSNLIKSIENNSHAWTHVERPKVAVSGI